ncbi:hypothetical protein AWENTII_004041 [Aspergillus wentii]
MIAMRKFASQGGGSVDLGEDRRLPPLPRVEPGPRGPFNPFNNAHIFAPSPPSSQDAFPVKAAWPSSEHIVAPPSPANSADSSWQESFAAQKAAEWPLNKSLEEAMALIQPRNINRKPPLQQLCGRKRKGSMISSDPDDQREKHRVAEGNRRKNLSQLHRELDSRIHDYFLECAGWNPAKSLPQSKEHIVQGAIHLIDTMKFVINTLASPDNEQVAQLPEKLQPQLRSLQLQHMASNLQMQNQSAQQQIKSLKLDNQTLEERNRTLEFQLRGYEHMFRSPKSETNSPPPVGPVPEPKSLPGLRVVCDSLANTHSPESTRMDRLPSCTSQTYGHSFLSSTPPMTGPSSPVFPSYSVPNSRRESMIPSP